MAQPSPLDWDRARDILRRWLTAQECSMRAFAERAGLQPSFLSRFLSGASALTLDSALRAYDRLKEDMPPRIGGHLRFSSPADGTPWRSR